MREPERDRLSSGAAWNLLNCSLPPVPRLCWSLRRRHRRTNRSRCSCALRRPEPSRSLPFALALVAGALFVPSPTHGLTLGNVASLSALGQPLRVVIPVALEQRRDAEHSLRQTCRQQQCLRRAANSDGKGQSRAGDDRGALADHDGKRRSANRRWALRSRPDAAARRVATTSCCSTRPTASRRPWLPPPMPRKRPWTRMSRAERQVPRRQPQQPPVDRRLGAAALDVGHACSDFDPVADARPKAPEKIAPEPQSRQRLRSRPRPHRASSSTVSSSRRRRRLHFRSRGSEPSVAQRHSATTASQAIVAADANRNGVRSSSTSASASGSRCGRTPLRYSERSRWR